MPPLTTPEKRSDDSDATDHRCREGLGGYYNGACEPGSFSNSSNRKLYMYPIQAVTAPISKATRCATTATAAAATEQQLRCVILSIPTLDPEVNSRSQGKRVGGVDAASRFPGTVSQANSFMQGLGFPKYYTTLTAMTASISSLPDRGSDFAGHGTPAHPRVTCLSTTG
jgi:hypothetical protein